MNSEYIEAFVNATRLVFEKIVSLKTEAGKPFASKNGIVEGDVSSIIGFTGHMSGTFSISVNEPFLMKISTHLLRKEIEHISDEVVHVAAKLADMISTEVKDSFELIDRTLEFATPTTFSGRHSIASMATASRTSVPFKSGTDSFMIRICLGA